MKDTWKRNTSHTFYFQQWESENNTCTRNTLFFSEQVQYGLIDEDFNYNYEMEEMEGSGEGEESMDEDVFED